MLPGLPQLVAEPLPDVLDIVVLVVVPLFTRTTVLVVVRMTRFRDPPPPAAAASSPAMLSIALYYEIQSASFALGCLPRERPARP